MYFDSHSHYYDSRFKSEFEGGADALLERLFADKLSYVINVGDSIKNSKKCIAQAAKYSKMYVAAGIHPGCAGRDESLDDARKALCDLLDDADKNKIVAVGEIGFDYHYNDFLEGYYGDAAEYIAEYHTITKKMIDEKMAKKGHLIHWFGTDENFDFKYNRATQSYDMTYIDQINELWDDAVNSVVGTTLDHVKKSRIHWTYIELFNTMDNRMQAAIESGDEDICEELVARNEELYNDILKYGTTRKFNNAYDISTNITNFTLSPAKGQWLRP